MTSSHGSNLAHLTGLVEAEIRLLMDELRPLLVEKQQVLVSDELDKLQQLAERETTLAGRLASIEAQRIAAVASIATVFGVDEEQAVDTTMAQLLDWLPASDETQVLAAKAAELERILLEAGWLNADNHHLTQNRLEYTDFVMRLIASCSGNRYYGADGRVADGPPARVILDNTI